MSDPRAPANERGEPRIWLIKPHFGGGFRGTCSWSDPYTDVTCREPAMLIATIRTPVSPTETEDSDSELCEAHGTQVRTLWADRCVRMRVHHLVAPR